MPNFNIPSIVESAAAQKSVVEEVQREQGLLDLGPEAAQEMVVEEASPPPYANEPEVEEQEAEERAKTTNSPSASDYVIDAALAIPRGVEGFAESVYGLADWITMDVLPDWDRQQDNLFGRSKTVTGNLGEGIVQFATGFVPLIGPASKISGVAKAGALAGKSTDILSRGVLQAAANGSKTAKLSTLRKLSKAKPKVRKAAEITAAAAIADFITFKGEASRFSNLLQDWKGEGSSAIIDYLSYNPAGDNNILPEFLREAEERVKNVVEGLVLGGALGGTFVAGKAAVSGITKTLKIMKDQGEIVAKQQLEPRPASKLTPDEQATEDFINRADEVLAFIEARRKNPITLDERLAMRELTEAHREVSVAKKYENATGLKIEEETPIYKQEEEMQFQLTGDFKEAPSTPVKKDTKIDPEKATPEQIDAWFLKNRNTTTKSLSEDSKRAALKDTLSKAGQKAEGILNRIRDRVRAKLKDNDMFVGGTQSIYAATKLATSRPEMRAILDVLAEEELKKVTKEGFVGLEQIKGQIQHSLDAAGVRGYDVDSVLEAAKNSKDDLIRLQVEQQVLAKSLVSAWDNVGKAVANAREAADNGVVVTTKDGKEVSLGQSAAMTEVHSMIDRFLAIREEFNFYGSSFSLGLNARKSVYPTKTTSIGRSMAGDNKALGFIGPLDASNQSTLAQQVYRTSVRGSMTDKQVLKALEKITRKTANPITGGKSIDDMGNIANQLEETWGLSKMGHLVRRGLAVSQEVYINSLVGSPTTWAVNLIGNGITLALRNFEIMAGAALTGNMKLLKANLKTMFHLQTWIDSIKYAKKSLFDDEAKSLQGYTQFKNDRLHSSKGEIYSEKGLDGHAGYKAINWLGKAVRHPTRVLMAGDEFFKQMSFRVHARTQLGVEAYERGLHHNPQEMARFIQENFEGLITNQGRFRNESNILREAEDSIAKRKAGGEVIEDESFEKSKYLDEHYRAHRLEGQEGFIYQKSFGERKKLVDDATDFALINTFTNEVTGAVPKALMKVANFSPWLTYIIPFVRTPTNLIHFALGRVMPSPISAVKGAQKVATVRRNPDDFMGVGERQAAARDIEIELNTPSAAKLGKPGDASYSEATKQMLEDKAKLLARANSMEAAEFTGRMAAATLTWGSILYLVDTIRDKITGAAPTNPAKRAAWDMAGKQAYAIKIGDKYHSYQRLDPFSTILGIAADYVHGHADAKEDGGGNLGNEEELEEKRKGLMQIAAVTMVSIAKNTSQKSYVENLYSLFQLLMKPNQTRLTNMTGQIISGFVPNALNVSQNVFQEEPEILESRKILDKMMKKLPKKIRPNDFLHKAVPNLVSPSLPPKRNMLGEPRVKQNVGGLLKGLNPIFQSDVASNIVDMEIASHGVGKGNMSSFIRVGRDQLDLRKFYNDKGQDAYDRMQQITSEVKIGGRTLRQALKATIETAYYQGLPEVTDMNKGMNHPRTAYLNKIVGRYRAMAKDQMFREYASVRKKYRQLLNQ